jgi:hypothetical protein
MTAVALYSIFVRGGYKFIPASSPECVRYFVVFSQQCNHIMQLYQMLHVSHRKTYSTVSNKICTPFCINSKQCVRT